MRRTDRGARSVEPPAVAAAAWLHAQGREWTTAAFDAQRTGWVRTDARLTREPCRRASPVPVEGEVRKRHASAEFVDAADPARSTDRIQRLQGAGIRRRQLRPRVRDRHRSRAPYWTTHLNYSAATGGQPESSWECPGGLIATPTRRTVLAPQALRRRWRRRRRPQRQRGRRAGPRRRGPESAAAGARPRRRLPGRPTRRPPAARGAPSAPIPLAASIRCTPSAATASCTRSASATART